MNAEVLQIISIVSFSLAALFLVIAAILYFRLDVRGIMDDLSGKKAERQIRELREENRQSETNNNGRILYDSAVGTGEKTTVKLGFGKKKERTSHLTEPQPEKKREKTRTLKKSDETTELLQTAEEGTTVLRSAEEGTTVLGSAEEGTTVLGDEDNATTVLGEEDNATTVLGEEDMLTTTLEGVVEEGTTVLGSAEEGTTVLGSVEEGTTVLGSAEEVGTTVLANGFRLVLDEVVVHTEERI